MNLPPKRRGFTLIELLVVIAIINVLSAIVLASLSEARKNANDVAIKANLATIQVEAEVYAYSRSDGTYGNQFTTGDCFTANANYMFFADTTIKNAVTAIKNIGVSGSDALTCNTCKVAGSCVAYAAQAKLTSGEKYACVDSTGMNSISETWLGAGNTVCPP